MIEKRLFLGFVRVHLLHHAGEGEIYGTEMLEELGRHGYAMSAGTLYPILHELEKAGCLKGRKAVVKGKARRYYAITPLGRRVLGNSKRKIKELAGEVLPGG